MSLLPCQGCKSPVDANAKTCPHCGRSNPATRNGPKIALAIVGVCVVGYIVQQCGSMASEIGSKVPAHPMEKLAEQQMARIDRKVLDDARREYDFVKRNGSKMDACVHAGFVSAAYVGVKDADGFKRWKLVEDADCARAGVPVSK